MLPRKEIPRSANISAGIFRRRHCTSSSRLIPSHISLSSLITSADTSQKTAASALYDAPRAKSSSLEGSSTLQRGKTALPPFERILPSFLPTRALNSATASSTIPIIQPITIAIPVSNQSLFTFPRSDVTPSLQPPASPRPRTPLAAQHLS